MHAQLAPELAFTTRKGSMSTSSIRRRWWVITVLIAVVVPIGSAKAPDLNPAALAYKLPDQIHWSDDPMGLKSAILFGDPSKPGLYIMLVKWTPHPMSHPHFHPNDRFITVLSGTWWVGTGSKFDPESTLPLPASMSPTWMMRARSAPGRLPLMRR